MSFIAVDIGASDTRFTSENCKIGVIPNNVVVLESDDKVNIDVSDNCNIEDALEVEIIKDRENDFFPAHVLVGNIANRYKGTNERPSGLVSKHKQKINYISYIVATAVHKLKYGMDEQLDAYIALPPVEVEVAKDYVNEQLIGKYQVKFPKYHDAVVEFEIVSTMCLEESFLALLAFFFEMNGSLRPSAQKYGRGNLLSLDIGASTSDLAVAKDMVYLNKSGKTYKTGGNIAREFIADDVRSNYSYDITDEEAQIVMSEGRLPMGNTFVDMSKSVNNAKKELAGQIMKQLQNYFRTINVPIQSIRGIVVSGGGSMESKYINEDGEEVVTSKPVSEYIVEELKQVCEGIDVIQFDGNPRLANITGMFIRASMETIRKQRNKK